MPELTERSSTWRATILRYAPVLLWIGLIFYLSSYHGSMSATSRFIKPLLQFLFPTAPAETLQIYHGYVRKAAHCIEYAILAILALRAFSRSSIGQVRKLRLILPLVLVAAVAVTDELNQSFEASRTGSVGDIVLDIAGGLVVMTIMWGRNRER